MELPTVSIGSARDNWPNIRSLDVHLQGNDGQSLESFKLMRIISYKWANKISDYSLNYILNGKIWEPCIASVGSVLHVNIKLAVNLVYTKTKLLYSTIYLFEVWRMEPETTGVSS